MKILVLADTHLGIRLEGFSRFSEIKKAMNKISKYAIKNKFDFVIHNGDVFDSNKPNSKELAFLIRWLKLLSDAKVEVRILTGNHDVYYKQEEGNSILDIIKEINFPHVRVIDFVGSDLLFKKKIRLLYLPFITPIHCQSMVRKLYSDRKDIKNFGDVQNFLDRFVSQKLKVAGFQKIYVFSHLDFEDKKLLTPFREIKLHLPKQLLKSRKVKKIFQGHFHNKTSIEKIKIVGSPLSLSFAEAKATKGFYTFTI